MPQVATGDMLREAVAEGTPLGREAKRYMDSGALVPDDVVIGLVDERLARPDAGARLRARRLSAYGGAGGGPRRAAGPEAAGAGPGDLLRRVARRSCSAGSPGAGSAGSAATAFHLVSAPPKAAGRCDQCGGELYQREDDAEATVARRLDVYQTQTAPLLDYYRQRGLLARVAGEGPVEEVADRDPQGGQEPVSR